MLKELKLQAGAVAIYTIVAVGAISLIMVIGAARSGFNELEMADNYEKAGKVLSLAEGCAENALRRLQSDYSYLADEEEIIYGNGICRVSAIDDGSFKIINVKAEIGSFYKKIEIEASLADGQIIVENWKEIS